MRAAARKVSRIQRGRASARDDDARAGIVASGPAASLLDLQRDAGNRAVTELLRDPSMAPGLAAPALAVQRAGDVAATHVLDPVDEGDVPEASELAGLKTEWVELDAKKKQASANTPFDPADAKRLAEVNRLIGLRYKKDVAMTLAGNGRREGPAAWFAEVKTRTFLGKDITVHTLLADRLKTAETAFLKAVAGKAPPEGGWVRSTNTLRGPTEGLHGLGLAIDLNPGTNPYLVSPGPRSQAATGEPRARSQAVRNVIDRAVLLVLGRTAAEEDFGSAPDVEAGTSRVKASYDKIDEASAALRRYFELGARDRAADLEELVARLGPLNPRGRTAAAWRRTIAADRRAIGGHAGAKRWTNPEQGFLDLAWPLVEALTDAGLTWLGDVVVGSGRDIMHFDMRGLGPIRRIYKSESGSWVNLGG